MKWIITCIFTLILYPALLAQDTIPTPAVTEPVPVSEPVNEVQAAANPQPENAVVKKDWKKNLYFGGYVNFSLGSYTSMGIEPMVGYKIIPILSVGAKIRYDYVKDNRSYLMFCTTNTPPIKVGSPFIV